MALTVRNFAFHLEERSVCSWCVLPSWKSQSGWECSCSSQGVSPSQASHSPMKSLPAHPPYPPASSTTAGLLGITPPYSLPSPRSRGSPQRADPVADSEHPLPTTTRQSDHDRQAKSDTFHKRVYVHKEELVFPTTPVGEFSMLKLHVCNKEVVNLKVQCTACTVVHGHLHWVPLLHSTVWSVEAQSTLQHCTWWVHTEVRQD